MNKIFASTVVLFVVIMMLFGQAVVTYKVFTTANTMAVSGTATSGYVLTATGANAATWQVASGGASDCTSVVTAGTAGIASTPSANSVYCITGAQSAQTAITLSAPNVTFRCLPGTTITRTSGGITLLTITGDGFKSDGCNLGTGGTSGGLLVSIGSGGNNAKFLHGKMTGASTNASNAGWFVQTQGSGLLVDDFGCDSTVVDNCMSILASTGDTSDFKVTNTSFSNGGSDKRGLRIGNSSSNTIYNGAISNITCQVTGSCVFFNWAGTPKPRAIVMNNVSHELGGDITTAEPFSIYGCSRCTFSNLAFNDQNHGMTNLPAFALHDLDFVTISNLDAYFLNAGTQCLLALDSHDSVVNGVTCRAGSLFSTSGRGTVELGIGAPGSNLNNMTFSNINIVLQASLANAIGFHAGNDATGTIDNLVLKNITVTGDVTSGQAGISLTTAGGSIASPIIGGISLNSVTTGISIGSGVTNAVIGSDLAFKSVTTRFSDSGTNTLLQSLKVAYATQTSKTTAQTTATLFTPDADAQYRIGGSINCDSTSAAATVNITIGWTDPSNQAQTSTLASAAACTALGASSFGQLLFPFRAKSGTNITYATSIVNTPTYDVSVHLEQVTTK